MKCFMEETLPTHGEELSEKEKEYEKHLRPLKFTEFSGQSRIIENLKIFVKAARQRKEALDHYTRSISNEGFSEEQFLEVFEEDLPHLIEQGIDKEDVPIMLDQLRYFLENK